MDSAEKLRRNVEDRLNFLEFRLYWEGRVNRSDLMKVFGISTPQASADLSKYQELAPGNIEYDPREKAYITTKHFRPVRGDPNGRQYLAYLRMFSNHVMAKEETWLGWTPTFDAIPQLIRRIDSEKLRAVLITIQRSKALEIEYQSLSRHEPTWRYVTPHALAFDGRRWHVRAWCHLRESFRDFVFARILHLGNEAPAAVDATADLAWQEYVTFRLGPNPKLPEAARRAIEIDYDMREGVLEVPTRLALSYYFERNLNLDIDLNSVVPQRQQVVWLNRTEVEATREEITRRVSEQTSGGIEK